MSTPPEHPPPAEPEDEDDEEPERVPLPATSKESRLDCGCLIRVGGPVKEISWCRAHKPSEVTPKGVAG